MNSRTGRQFGGEALIRADPLYMGWGFAALERTSPSCLSMALEELPHYIRKDGREKRKLLPRVSLPRGDCVRRGDGLTSAANDAVSRPCRRTRQPAERRHRLFPRLDTRRIRFLRRRVRSRAHLQGFP